MALQEEERSELHAIISAPGRWLALSAAFRQILQRCNSSKKAMFDRAKLPLNVRFFCKDVYDVWLRWSERVDGEIRPGVKVLLDLKQPMEPPDEPAGPVSAQIKQQRKRDAIGKGGTDGIDVGYSKLKAHVEKSLFLLAGGEANRCAVCAEDIKSQAQTLLVCSLTTCRAVFHMTCLAQSFLDQEHQKNALIPTSGRCPQCSSELQWVDLVKEMSLRVRGEAEVAKLMKMPKVPKAKVMKDKEELLAEATAEAIAGEVGNDHSHRLEDDSDSTSSFEDPLPDDWHFQEIDDDEDDRVSVASVTSNASTRLDPMSHTIPIGRGPSSKVVIDDSDENDVEVLD
ncbi:Slx4p interacting protein [Pseudocyphellaria aurata]|nr:Slx4p interacting protein [Pseudocyphellaria aurata]